MRFWDFPTSWKFKFYDDFNADAFILLLSPSVYAHILTAISLIHNKQTDSMHKCVYLLFCYKGILFPILYGRRFTEGVKLVFSLYSHVPTISSVQTLLWRSAYDIWDWKWLAPFAKCPLWYANISNAFTFSKIVDFSCFFLNFAWTVFVVCSVL